MSRGASAEHVAAAWRTRSTRQRDGSLAGSAPREGARIETRRLRLTVQRGAESSARPQRSHQARFLRRMGLYGMEVAAEALQRPGRVCAAAAARSSVGVGGLRAHWDDMMAALAAQQPTPASAPGIAASSASTRTGCWATCRTTCTRSRAMELRLREAREQRAAAARPARKRSRAANRALGRRCDRRRARGLVRLAARAGDPGRAGRARGRDHGGPCESGCSL